MVNDTTSAGCQAGGGGSRRYAPFAVRPRGTLIRGNAWSVNFIA
jgi:hypothetical protein